MVRDAVWAAAGLSRTKLAAELDVTEKTVGRWERREFPIPSDKLARIARLLGTTVDELMAGWPEPEKEDS